MIFSGSQNCHIVPEGTTHIYIYIVVELLTGPSLGFLIVINWSKLAFLKTLFVKNTIKYGFQHVFNTKKIARENFY